MTQRISLLLALALSLGACRGAEPLPPTTPDDTPPVPPPPGAVVLFDGDGLDAWRPHGGQPPAWPIEDGVMTVGKGTLVSRDTFGDLHLHVEFWLPRYPDNVKGQARANSGVFVHGRYEVQVLDVWGHETLKPNECAAIYSIKAPDTNAARPPEQWQTYDILYRMPRYRDDGSLASPPAISVFWNGVKVHDVVELPVDKDVRAGEKDPSRPGPIMLQDHGNPLRYRSVWLVPGEFDLSADAPPRHEAEAAATRPGEAWRRVRRSQGRR